MGFFKRLFGGKPSVPNEPVGPQWYDESIYQDKMRLFERELGPGHQTMIAALIGWDLGGPVDLWIFPNHNSGTIFTTMQMVMPGPTSQQKNKLGKYELAAATRHKPDPPMPKGAGLSESESSYEAMSLEIRTLLSGAARYSEHIALQPLETAEVQGDSPNDPNTCLIFDTLLGPEARMSIDNEGFSVLLIIRVHPSELDHAREHGTQSLIDELKAAGAYPFSDLDRVPVA